MAKTVIGIFNLREDAESAIAKLDVDGYNPKDISIIMKDIRVTKTDEGTTDEVAEGAVTGATAGAVLGGLAGLVASFVLPGLGGFFIGGPIAGALGLAGSAASTISGAAAGAVAGGLFGALTGLGFSEEEARSYEDQVREGSILVAVSAKSGEEGRVEEILKDSGATNVRSAEPQTVRREFGPSKEEHAEEEAAYQAAQRRPAYSYVGTKGGKSSGKSRKVSKKVGSKGKKGGRVSKGKDVPGRD